MASRNAHGDVSLYFFLIGLVFERRSGGVATSERFRRGELDEVHGRHEMLRERRDCGIGVALERGMHDCRVFGLDVAGFFGVAPDCEPQAFTSVRWKARCRTTHSS